MVARPEQKRRVAADNALKAAGGQFTARNRHSALQQTDPSAKSLQGNAERLLIAELQSSRQQSPYHTYCQAIAIRITASTANRLNWTGRSFDRPCRFSLCIVMALTPFKIPRLRTVEA
jgi:hypothetical protein